MSSLFFSAIGENGLATGIYKDSTSFVIQSRDQFSNRVNYGPVNEVQIIETIGGDINTVSPLTGSFSVSYNGYSVDVAAGAGLDAMRAALQSLPTIGAVDVSTNSVTDLALGLSAAVVQVLFMRCYFVLVLISMSPCVHLMLYVHM